MLNVDIDCQAGDTKNKARKKTGVEIFNFSESYIDISFPFSVNIFIFLY